VNRQLAADPTNVALKQQQSTLTVTLGSQLDALDKTRATYLGAQQNLALSQNLLPTSVAQVLSEAAAPSDPVSPKPLRDGVALALAREFLDQSIRTSDDLERAVKGRYPILGVIPEVSASEIAVLPG